MNMFAKPFSLGSPVWGGGGGGGRGEVAEGGGGVGRPGRVHRRAPRAPGRRQPHTSLTALVRLLFRGIYLKYCLFWAGTDAKKTHIWFIQRSTTLEKSANLDYS